MTKRNKPIKATTGSTTSKVSMTANFNLITDKLYVAGYSSPRGSQSITGELNYFLLTTIPSNGQIMLILNGIQLTQDYDFRLLDQGYGVPPVVEILNGNTVKTTDWLLATYIASIPQQASTSVFGSYFIDSILVSNFTNTSTSSYRIPGDNSLNYNPVTLNYEFFTTLPIDPTYALVVTVNGLKLAEEFQYFKSTSFDGRIIFDKLYTTFSLGDVIFYVNNGTKASEGDVQKITKKLTKKQTEQYISGSQEIFLFQTQKNYSGNKQVLSTPFLSK